MLILSRRGGECIQVGDVCIKIVKISNKRVSVGIDAPIDRPIRRSELEPHDAASPPMALLSEPDA